MNIDESRIRAIVEEVLRTLSQAGGQAGPPSPDNDGVFLDVDAAVDAAEKAQRELMGLSLERRREIVAAIRKAGLDMAEESARRACEETGMGNVPDKTQKHVIVSTLTPGVEDLEQKAWTGDHGLTVVEMAPYGVIASVTPSTHPVPTILNNAISILAAGNSVVFNPHPGARKVSAFGLQRINRGIVAAGGPPNLLTMVEGPTIETANALFRHPKVALILVTGGPGVARAAMNAPKRAVVAGPGNPPVVVDETVPAQALLEAMLGSRPAVVQDLWLFDLYRGKGVDAGKKSLAFRVVMQDTSKTLTDAEAEAAMAQLLQLLAQRVDAKLRT